jgi:hypothetical protein
MQMQEALDRCEFAIRHQQEEIARLRAELDRKDEELTQLLAWINGDSDALTVLQRTYMDPRISTSDRIKACGAASPYLCKWRRPLFGFAWRDVSRAGPRRYTLGESVSGASGTAAGTQQRANTDLSPEKETQESQTSVPLWRS